MNALITLLLSASLLTGFSFFSHNDKTKADINGDANVKTEVRADAHANKQAVKDTKNEVKSGLKLGSILNLKWMNEDKASTTKDTDEHASSTKPEDRNEARYNGAVNAEASADANAKANANENSALKVDTSAVTSGNVNLNI